MLTIVKILSFIALLGAVAWFIHAPDFEPGIAIVTSLSALILAWVTSNRDKESQSPNQNQTIGDSSVGVQSGRDVTIGDISINKDSDRAK